MTTKPETETEQIIVFNPSHDKDFYSIYYQLFPYIKTPEQANGIAKSNAVWCKYTINDIMYGFYTIYIVDKNTIVLYNFAICAEYQNKGYGRNMLKYIVKKYAHISIILFVEKINKTAIQLYKSQGFKNTKKYQWPKNQICMALMK
jgi:ribosomal protein S18 acetylase RimI-like enzyme